MRLKVREYVKFLQICASKVYLAGNLTTENNMTKVHCKRTLAGHSEQRGSDETLRKIQEKAHKPWRYLKCQ